MSLTGNSDTGCNSGTAQRKAPSQRKRSSPQDSRAAIKKAVAIGSKDRRSMCIVDPTRTQSLGKIDSRSLQDDYGCQQCLISTKSPNQDAIARLSIRKDEPRHQGGHSNNQIKGGPLPHRHHSDPNMDTIWSTDPHHFLENSLPVIGEHDDNTDNGMDTLWRGRVYAAENSAAGDYHSFTVSASRSMDDEAGVITTWAREVAICLPIPSSPPLHTQIRSTTSFPSSVFGYSLRSIVTLVHMVVDPLISNACYTSFLFHHTTTLIPLVLHQTLFLSSWAHLV
jgi:hypothetical protein